MGTHFLIYLWPLSDFAPLREMIPPFRVLFHSSHARPNGLRGKRRLLADFGWHS
jgi:hypothetical protein